MHIVRHPRPAWGRQRHPSQGFTMIELMVTIAILAVLAALAAPSFNPIIERYRTRQAAEDLQGTLYLARSEAIKRGGGVTVEAVGGDWAGGWAVKAGGADLQTTAAPTKITATNVDGNGTITTDRWGMLSSNAKNTFHIQLTPKGGNAANGSTLCINPGGLIRREDGATSCPNP